MDSISFITKNLRELFTSHPYLEIKYEYRSNIATHIIEVKPAHCYDKDKEYIQKQIALEEQFEQLFPYEEILFMTENVLIQIENPILELGTSLIEQISEEIIIAGPNINYISFDEYVSFENEDAVELFNTLSMVNANNYNYYINCSQSEIQNIEIKNELIPDNNFYVIEPPSNSNLLQKLKNIMKKDSEINQGLFFFSNIAV